MSCCRKLLVLIIGCLGMIDTWAEDSLKVYPTHWWVGMKNPHLQLLVHGKDIATRTVNMSYPGIKVLQVHKVENPN